MEVAVSTPPPHPHPISYKQQLYRDLLHMIENCWHCEIKYRIFEINFTCKTVGATTRKITKLYSPGKTNIKKLYWFTVSIGLCITAYLVEKSCYIFSQPLSHKLLVQRPPTLPTLYRSVDVKDNCWRTSKNGSCTERTMQQREVNRFFPFISTISGTVYKADQKTKNFLAYWNITNIRW